MFQICTSSTISTLTIGFVSNACQKLKAKEDLLKTTHIRPEHAPAALIYLAKEYRDLAAKATGKQKIDFQNASVAAASAVCES